MNRDGIFRADGLATGKYHINLIKIDNGELQGSAAKRFQIDATSDASPLDLGTVNFRFRNKLEIGSVASIFTVQTFKGETISLSDFAGKFVLLDFWSTLLVNSTQDWLLLQSIHDAYRSDPRLVVLSVNTERDLSRAREFAKHRNPTWLQTWNSEEPGAPINDYIYRMPARFLISPDGKIVAKDIRGEKTKEAVQAALGSSQ